MSNLLEIAGEKVALIKECRTEHFDFLWKEKPSLLIWVFLELEVTPNINVPEVDIFKAILKWFATPLQFNETPLDK